MQSWSVSQQGMKLLHSEAVPATAGRVKAGRAKASVVGRVHALTQLP